MAIDKKYFIELSGRTQLTVEDSYDFAKRKK
jgi:hypothetical protein